MIMLATFRSPLLGEHSEYVYKILLGLNGMEFDLWYKQRSSFRDTWLV